MDLQRMIEALRTARPCGSSVRDWSVYGTDSRRLSLGIKDRQVGNAHAPLTLAESGGARYLVVWDDGRVSRGFFERRQVEIDPLEALSHARAAAYDDPDAAQVLGPAEIPRVELHDRSAASVAAGEIGPVARRLESIRRRTKAERIRTWSGSFSASEARSELITSAGFHAEMRGTSIGWHVSLDGEIGDGYGARRAEPDSDFDARLERLIRTAQRLREPARSMAGAIRPVILHPKVVEAYVLETLLIHLDGSTVDHGEGQFRRAQFGTDRAVIREDLRLRLDPLQPLKSGSYRFTAAGLPASRCTFIDRGRLVQPVLNLKYARRLGLPPTPLPLAMDTVHLEGPEPLRFTDALRAAEDGALVLSVLGAHTQDRSSGDFSLSAPQTLHLGGGELRGRVRATLSGNLFEVLRSDALHLVEFEGETTPGLLFRCRLDP